MTFDLSKPTADCSDPWASPVFPISPESRWLVTVAISQAHPQRFRPLQADLSAHLFLQSRRMFASPERFILISPQGNQCSSVQKNIHVVLPAIRATHHQLSSVNKPQAPLALVCFLLSHTTVPAAELWDGATLTVHFGDLCTFKDF